MNHPALRDEALRDNEITIKALVLATSLLVGKSELDLVGVFRADDNLIPSERRPSTKRLFVLYTDDTFLTLTQE